MSLPTRSRALAILLTLALAASPVLAADEPVDRPAGRTPSASGIASLWNLLLNGLLATPSPPPGDPDRGISIDPWG